MIVNGVELGRIRIKIELTRCGRCALLKKVGQKYTCPVNPRKFGGCHAPNFAILCQNFEPKEKDNDSLWMELDDEKRCPKCHNLCFEISDAELDKFNRITGLRMYCVRCKIKFDIGTLKQEKVLFT